MRRPGHAKSSSAFLIGAALLAIAPSIASAQGVPITVPSNLLPVDGSGPGFANEADKAFTWSSRSTSMNGVDGWRYLLLADVTGDGLDDLCGLYGPVSNGQSVYGCVVNQAGGGSWSSLKFGGTFRQAYAFNGTPNPSIHSTIQAVDFNGDGRIDLCGRTSAGMYCHTSTSGGFSAPVLISALFSDSHGWTDEKYFSAIRFGRLDGVLALCGRDVQGAFCLKKSGSAFSTSVNREGSYGFADQHGWDLPKNFRTFRFVDVNGDGNTDVCGRGAGGIWCAFWSRPRYSANGAWGAPIALTSQFADADGWGTERYYASIRYGDIGANPLGAEVCGRGSAGLYCGTFALSGNPPLGPPTFKWASALIPNLPVGDGAGWGVSWHDLLSIQLVDFDGDGKNDFCGLRINEFFCAPSITPSTSPATANTSGAQPTFGAMERRIRSVTVTQGSGTTRGFERDSVIAGKLFPATFLGWPVAQTGFCWASSDGAAVCSYFRQTSSP
jgi:hypothetical protein